MPSLAGLSCPPKAKGSGEVRAESTVEAARGRYKRSRGLSLTLWHARFIRSARYYYNSTYVYREKNKVVNKKEARSRPSLLLVLLRVVPPDPVAEGEGEGAPDLVGHEEQPRRGVDAIEGGAGGRHQQPQQAHVGAALPGTSSYRSQQPLLRYSILQYAAGPLLVPAS